MICWAVKHRRSIRADSIRETCKDAKFCACWYENRSWEDLEAEGYSVVKVEVTEIEADTPGHQGSQP